jgi:hypothetical protein
MAMARAGGGVLTEPCRENTSVAKTDENTWKTDVDLRLITNIATMAFDSNR